MGRTKHGRKERVAYTRRKRANILLPACSLMALVISACKAPGLFRRAFINTVMDGPGVGGLSNDTKTMDVLEA